MHVLTIVLYLHLLALITSDKSENKLFFLNSNSLQELKIVLPDFTMRSTTETKVLPEFQEAVSKEIQNQEVSLHGSEPDKTANIQELGTRAANATLHMWSSWKPACTYHVAAAQETLPGIDVYTKRASEGL